MQDLPTLTYFPDSRPGITRRRQGRGWRYFAPDGTGIDAKDERKRLNALAVPPAYSDVWMCPDPRGHLQATGRDDRARKQYRYHEDWTAFRARKKFDHLATFGEALPALRRRIRRDLRDGTAGDHDFAIAAILALLDRANLRVGNPDYARRNQTFGATTLRPRHLQLDGGEVQLDYRAKGGDQVRKRLRDRTLNRVLERLDDLGGPTLVSWEDSDGTSRAVGSDTINQRLADWTGQEAISAKTFRTWNGTVAAFDVATRNETLSIKAMTEAAAERLHNTPAICRTSYVHPWVIALSETPFETRRRYLETAPETRGLRQAEAGLLALLSE
ncbi:DNA topoisomerase-1 [Roseivivax lentus]|uniref:DNA topoisomerase n=1 Tax=Roseivivax lentus TaxID=633194 RepID=A0A1N7MAI0_9RHOB|nr:DNA topoisomerase IB [Roseivivax lentus]SIS82981.1 DNA topoisomerase-1 [Roseivivax lentus]